MPALLRPLRGAATKTIGPSGVVSDYAAGGAFVGRNVTLPPDVTEQAAWLRIHTKRDEFLIAGAIRDDRGDMRTLINRRYLDRAGWASPDVLDVSQIAIFADCDGVRGARDFREDPVAAAMSVRDLIPELRGVACVFVGSSQAGRSELVRGKFLFSLAAPKSMPELRAWAEDVNRRTGGKIIDPALYNPVQPVYLAAPQFVDGAVDPMPERVLVLPGDERPIVLPEPAPYSRAPPPGVSSAPRVAISKLWANAPFENDDLGARSFNFEAPKDAVRLLTHKGHFNRDENKYDHMRDLAFACAYAEIRREAPAADVRELYFEVVAATKRDRDFNERLYADALRRTPALISGGAKIVTLGSIIHRAIEEGWTGIPHAAPAFAPPAAIELAIVKAKAVDAYKLGRLASRDRALSRLARFCADIGDADVKRELAKTVAAVLAQDGWPLSMIRDAGTSLGLRQPDAVSLAQWAIQKQQRQGANT